MLKLSCQSIVVGRQKPVGLFGDARVEQQRATGLRRCQWHRQGHLRQQVAEAGDACQANDGDGGYFAIHGDKDPLTHREGSLGINNSLLDVCTVCLVAYMATFRSENR